MSSLVELQKVGADKEILYIENNTKLQKSFGVYFQKTFKKFFSATSVEEGYKLFKENKPHIVIMELDLEGKDPIEFIDDLQEIKSNVIIITLSEKTENYEFLQTLDMGLAQMLLKPISFPQIASTLIKILPPAVIEKNVEKKELKTTPKKKLPVSKENKKASKTVTPKKEPVKIEPKKEQISKPKVKKQEPKKEAVKEVVKPKTPSELCFEFIEKLVEKKVLVEFFNSYKGVTVQNYGDIISCHKDYFEVQVGLSQIVASKYEKFIILRTEDNKYIHAKLEQINLKNGSLKLVEPRFLDFQHRDKNYNRYKADKSCKATIYFEKKRVEFLVDYLSFRSAELIVQNKEIKFQKGDTFDLTLGFDVGGPNKMIKDKKFVKVFARCEVLRIDEKGKFNKIVVLLQVKKAGETTLLRYLSEREEEIMFEFKSIIHR